MFVSCECSLKSLLNLRRYGLLALLLLAANGTAFGQENLPGPLIHASFANPFGSPEAAESSSASPAADPLPQSNEPPHRVSWQTLPFDILHDQKYVWLFPVDLAKGKHWVPTLAVVGVTAGLIVADSHDMPYFAK